LGSHNKGATEAEGVGEQVVRKIVWHKRDEMTREWKRQHKEELYDV